ncbi:Integrin beta-1-binding protein 2, partial [Sticta canariensis]|nr:Integrin beta-1-binding protein 2 [Sticta canariensis]
WKCCKTRVLTFDEFLSIPPCTTGKHSTTDDTPAPEPPLSNVAELAAPAIKPKKVPDLERASQVLSVAQLVPPPPATPQSDSDDPALLVPPNTSCRRRGCNACSPTNTPCVYHPGQALFHEGSKGWTCCKKRVLEFEEFMRIEGCKRKHRHLFIGSGKNNGKEELLSTVRHDFYQTPTSVIASLFLKKIVKEQAKVEFSSSSVALDLPTADSTRYKTEVPLFAQINAAKSTYKILGTKLELSLFKVDGSSWPALRSDEWRTAGIIQVGRPGRA